VGGPTDEAVAAIRAWVRLDQAFTAFNRMLKRRYAVTGAQLAVLRLVHEWSKPSGAGSSTVGGDEVPSDHAVPLAAMRTRMVMHPATLGQLLDRLAERGLIIVSADPADRRRRLVALTAAGRELLVAAPLAGPVRLRHIDHDPDRLRRLAEALHDAITLFGLEEYRGDRAGDFDEHRPEAGGRPEERGRTRRGDPAGGRR
jgi:DNA-binding MarR family transcriptional regulator